MGSPAPYRGSANGRSRVLDVRPGMLLTNVLFALAVPVCLGVGALTAALAAGATGTGAGVYALMAVVFVLTSFVPGTLAYQGLFTVVRFRVDGEDLAIEWRRRGHVVKVESVRVADVVDVAISDTPLSNGVPAFGLVIGTRAGDISLSDDVATTRDRYVSRCAAMAAFLDVAVRP